jgi:hypothetical protein
MSALQKLIGNDLAHTRSMVPNTKDPRLMISLRHGGQEVFFNISVNNPPRGRPVGGGGIHRN